MQICTLVLTLEWPQNLCHTQTDIQADIPTDRHFIKIVKSYSEHPKTCKSVKNQKSKIFTIQILSSYTEYRRNSFSGRMKNSAHLKIVLFSIGGCFGIWQHF